MAAAQPGCDPPRDSPPQLLLVRRILLAERERKRRNSDELDRLLADLFTGRFPYVFVEHKVIGL